MEVCIMAITSHFCFLSAEDDANYPGMANGWAYVKANLGSLVPATGIEDLVSSYTAGRTFVVNDGKVYNIEKDYWDFDGGRHIYLCVESKDTRDVINISKNMEKPAYTQKTVSMFKAVTERDKALGKAYREERDGTETE